MIVACWAGLTRPARSDIIVYWSDPPIPRQLNWTYPLDLDFNGVADIVFRSDPSTYWAESANGSALLAIPSSPPNDGSFIIPLSLGDYIGPDLAQPAEWFDGTGGGLFVSCMAVGPGQVECLGLWPPDDGFGYFGLRFQIDDNIHYGWVLLDFSDFGTVDGKIVGWAYESDANTSLNAGVVPEPSTILLILAGSAGLFLARRKKRTR